MRAAAVFSPLRPKVFDESVVHHVGEAVIFQGANVKATWPELNLTFLTLGRTSIGSTLENFQRTLICIDMFGKLLNVNSSPRIQGWMWHCFPAIGAVKLQPKSSGMKMKRKNTSGKHSLKLPEIIVRLVATLPSLQWHCIQPAQSTISSIASNFILDLENHFGLNQLPNVPWKHESCKTQA